MILAAPDMLGTGSIILFEGATALLTWLKTIPTIHRRQRNDTSSVKSISLVLFLDGEQLAHTGNGFLSSYSLLDGRNYTVCVRQPRFLSLNTIAD